MTERDESLRSSRSWRRRIALAVSGLLTIACSALVLGAYVPAIPYVGALGSLALSLWPAWIIVLAAIGGMMASLGSGGNARRLFIALAALSTLGATVVIYQLVALARTNGVSLTIGHPFGFADGHGGSLSTVQPDEVVTYTHDLGEALSLRIYRPKRAAAGSSPVLMYVHGGGWISGANDQRSSDMRWFADRGWLVISAGYGLSSEKRHLWDRVTDQIGCAMAWTAANAASHGGDATRLSLVGESAGGNLVLNAGYLANAGDLRSTCGGRVPRVNAVSAIYPGVDLAAIHDNTYQPTGADVRDMVTKYIGGSPERYPGRYAAVASASNLGRNAPPTLLVMTENDHLVPVASMRTFEAKARARGVPIRTISVPYAEHGFDLTGIGNAIVRQTTLQLITEQDHNATLSERR